MKKKNIVNKLNILKCIVPFLVLICLLIQGICMLTPNWIETQELMNNPNYIKFNMSVNNEYLDKNTTSGLWVICQNEPGKYNISCSKIQYFSGDDYIPDPNDSTGAIPYAAKRAALFMTISTTLLIFGSILIIRDFIYLSELTCFYGLKWCCCLFCCLNMDKHRKVIINIRRKSSVLTFISAITFILAGLMVLAAMVVYISTFKAEIGNKLRPKSSFQGPLFNYKYGYSFYFNIASLLLCEFTGTLLIFLYIKQHQFEWKEQINSTSTAKEQQHYQGSSTHQQQQIHQIYPVTTPMMCLYHHSPPTQKQDEEEGATYQQAQQCYENKIPEIVTSDVRVGTLDSDAANDSSDTPVSPPIQFQQQQQRTTNYLQVPQDGVTQQQLLLGNVPLSDVLPIHCRTHTRGRRYSRSREITGCSPGEVYQYYLSSSPRGSFATSDILIASAPSRRSSSTSSAGNQVPPSDDNNTTTSLAALKRLDFRRQISIQEEEDESINSIDDDMMIPPPPPPPSIKLVRRKLLQQTSSSSELQFNFSFETDDEMSEDAEGDAEGDAEAEDEVSVSGTKRSFSCFNLKKRKRKKNETVSDDEQHSRRQKYLNSSTRQGSLIKKRKSRRSTLQKRSTLSNKTTQV